MRGRIVAAVILAAAAVGCSDNNPSSPDAGTAVAGAVDQLEIVSTYDAYGGATFGTVGAYEVVVGIVHGKLNPKHSANAGIVDLNLAPVDSNGMVSYTTDFVILRPKTPANAKRLVFYDVNNRGNQLANSFINNGLPGFAAGAQGDGLLLRLGYTLVWSGWQGNVTQTGHGDTAAIGATFPVAKNADGSSITAMSREEYVFDNATSPITVALTYPAATLDQSGVTFNYRPTWVTAQGMTWDSPSTAIPTSAWSYVDNLHVSINRPAGADEGSIYSFIYQAKDPIIMGIGFAAIRDFVTFLRNDAADAHGTANPLAGLKQAHCILSTGCSTSPTTNFDLAIMEGVSQSGRLARDFLWQGFNDDTRGHKVFEGLYPIIAGSRKTWTNFRFSQPGRFSKQHEDHFQANDQFPFGFQTMADPVSGLNDGIFKKCSTNNTCPYVIQVDGGYEVWGARAALMSTDGQGHDVAVPSTVRLFFVPGVNHGGGNGVGTQTKPAQCAYTATPISEHPSNRALVPVFEAWLASGTAPPDSRWPSVTAGTAADPTDRAAVGFPDLSGMGVAYGGNLYNQLFVTDYSAAIPVANLAKPYKVLVSKTDTKGNETAGILVPDVVAPIASYTNWNVRTTNFAPGDACYVYGAMIPFAATPAVRNAGDPRPALSELYSSHQDYVNKVTAAANALVTQRLLLQEDVAFYVTAAQNAAIP